MKSIIMRLDNEPISLFPYAVLIMVKFQLDIKGPLFVMRYRQM